MQRLTPDRAQALVEYFSASAAPVTSAAFADVFKACLISNFKYTVLYFVLSLTVYTAWCSCIIPAVKGFTAGFTAVFLIKNYAAHGVAYTFLAILPSAVISLPVYLFASAVCINFAAGRRRRGEVGARAAFGIVPALTVIYTVMAVCSLYDAAIAPFIFKNLF